MSLPELTKQQVEETLSEYCVNRIPPHARDQVRMGFNFRGNSVTLYEERPAFRQPETWVQIPVAQFRFDQGNNEWTLYCADRNSRWHVYYEIEPATNIESLLQELDDDPTGIFWG